MVKLLLLSLLATTAWLRAADTPAPTNFGIKDGEVPEDPRELGGRGKFLYLPNWQVNKELPDDTFTFARVRYHSEDHFSRYRSWRKWLVDYPESDINFSFRLQQLTSLQVNPKAAVVDIDPEQLRHYPFIYIVEPGHIKLSDEEAKILRTYLMNGGFLMVDDFWGFEEWDTFYIALKQIFPDREPVDLPLEHEIFHIVFPLKVKPQIPGVHFALQGRSQGITYETDKAGTEEVHYRAVYDDKKRMVMMICHNTDNGDGWEEEGTDPWYFREFSEKYGYPLGINIVFYALTH